MFSVPEPPPDPAIGAPVLDSTAYSRYAMFSPSATGKPPTTASADFCRSPPAPLGTGRCSTQPIDRPPRVRHATFPLTPAAYTATPSVQVSDFEELCLLIRCDCLLCDSCSSGQCFAVSATTLAEYLRIPACGCHPCLQLAVSLAEPAVNFPRQVIQPPPRVLKQRQLRRYAWHIIRNRRPESTDRRLFQGLARWQARS